MEEGDDSDSEGDGDIILYDFLKGYSPNRDYKCTQESLFNTKVDSENDKDEERYGSFVVVNNITILDILIRREFSLEVLKDNKNIIFMFQQLDFWYIVNFINFIKRQIYIDLPR
ncbi:hypothetical protein ACTA71_005441 [Dictyostelium dimigraforme]